MSFVRRGDLTIREDLIEPLARLGFRDLDDFFASTRPVLFKRKRDRRIAKLEVEGAPLFLKLHERPSSWREKLARGLGLWRSQARREWESIEALRALGLATAEPVAWGERLDARGERSLLVTQAAPGLALEATPERARDRAVLESLAATVRTLHAGGLVHRDLYLSHVFLDEAPVLIDLQRVGPAFFFERARVKDLAALHYSTPACVSRTDRLRFFRLYRGLSQGQSLGAFDRWRIAWIAAKARRTAKHERAKLARRHSGTVATLSPRT